MNSVVRNIVTDANWDAGRGGHTVTGIVLHTMVGTTASAQARFNDPTSQVSVHYGISLDGTITQWVDEANTAYQAGNYPVNQVTIGIEHEDNGNANDAVRTATLYESSSDLVADICKRYNIAAGPTDILLHKNVIDKTAYPGGTACPDGLDTNKIISMAAAKLQGDTDMVSPAYVDVIFNMTLPATRQGRGASAEEHTRYDNLVDPQRILDDIQPSNEYKLNQSITNTGVVAIRDGWAAQINSANAALADATKNVVTLKPGSYLVPPTS